MVTKLVGIVNLTPDSFSDGGNCADVAAMIVLAGAMAAAGAEVIDVGAESTRPGAVPLDPEEEWQRLLPFMEQVLPGLKGRCRISIDTRHAETARRALERGADWINDVGGFADAAMVEAVAPSGCALVVMHSLSIPADPKVTLPDDADPVAALLAFGYERVAALEAAGINRSRLIFDPGIGFGKTAAQSLEILRRAAELRVLGVPLLVGHSRKSFLKAFADGPPPMRDAATLAFSAYLMDRGVGYLRVHDVSGHAALRAIWREMGR
jgi:dihydropteroate synthase